MSTEENTTTTTPVVTVTTAGGIKDKIKNPKRVEQGKKLAQISRQAKLKKNLEREQQEAAKSATVTPSLGLGVIAGVVVIGVVYFAYGKFTTKDPTPASNIELATEQKLDNKRKPNFVTFD